MDNNLLKLQDILGYKFVKKNYLKQAITHTSYLNEQKLPPLSNNERLEFLGDAVLEIVISDYIFAFFSKMPEGEMTKLRAAVVCEETLASVARKLKLGIFLKMGKGELATDGNNRDSTLCDLFEAFIGALYLDGGYNVAKNFILTHLKQEIHNKCELSWKIDPKTHLQEQLQKDSQEIIEYRVIAESGPDHNKEFTVELFHGETALSKGSGKNKKEAEQNAARFAIEKYKLQ